jgi:hypothetical protein
MASASRQCGHHYLAPTGTRPTSVLSVAAYLEVNIDGSVTDHYWPRGSALEASHKTRLHLRGRARQAARRIACDPRRKRRVGIGPRYVQSDRQTLFPEDTDVKYLIERAVDPEEPAPVLCDRPLKMRGAAR